jgi:hypothetical protein
VTLLGTDGNPLPEVLTKNNDIPAAVTLPAYQAPVPTLGGGQYADFQLSGTNLTRSYGACPYNRQEQPASLRVVLPGGATFTVPNTGTANFGPFSSCDGRIEVSPIKN